jgi:hypothetical protein
VLLSLDYTGTNTRNLEALRGAPELRELSLDSTDVNDEAAEILASMPKLKVLNLYHTLMTEAGVARIKQTLPECRIIWDRDSALPIRRKS